MKHTQVELAGNTAEGYEISLGPVNLVAVVSESGMVGCGVFDVAVLDKFDLPAACVTGVATVDDLLQGEVRAANQAAQARGVAPGMSGKEAIEKMQTDA